MKKFIIAVLALICQMPMFAQTKATIPTIIAFPSNQYMNKNGFGQKVTTNGRTTFMPDYDQAFLEDPYLKTALITISDALREREYDIKMLEAALNNVREQSAIAAAENAEVSIEDKLMESVRPDIKLEVEFRVSSTLGPRKGWTINVAAVDAYTSDPVGAFPTVITDPSSEQPELVLKKAIAGNIDDLHAKIMNYFQDLHDNGRKVVVAFHSWSGVNFEDDEINGDPMNEYLEDWIAERALNNNSRLVSGSEHVLNFSVRIPFFDETGKPIDARRWSRQLRKDLQTLGVKATLRTRGLGRVDIYLGEKP